MLWKLEENDAAIEALLAQNQALKDTVALLRDEIVRLKNSTKRPRFKPKKGEVLAVGLAVSKYVQTDDTGARHDGKGGYCTAVGNEPCRLRSRARPNTPIWRTN